ncbi:MAG: OmpA family protein [Candidatus Riflebacteria bacterium]|nr:OmpA family protein [Candidatus Riflebacteria bacterium]
MAPGGRDDPLAPPRPGPSALGARLEAERRVVLFVPFPADQATLGPRAKPFLYRLLELLFDRPGLRLAIHGHAEAAAGAEAAQRLSLERAQAIKDWLVKFGIPAPRLQAVGHGATQPLALAEADPGMGRISRIEIVKDQ